MSKPITMKLHLPDKNEDEEEKDYYTTVGEVYEYQSDSGMDANKFGQWMAKQMMLLSFEERIGIKLYFDPEIDAISLVRKASVEEILQFFI